MPPALQAHSVHPGRRGSLHELRRGDESQQEFYGRILKVMAQLGGAAQMFSNLILSEQPPQPKGKRSVFQPLVISIVAFYMILSISTQDVDALLQKMESDAAD